MRWTLRTRDLAATTPVLVPVGGDHALVDAPGRLDLAVARSAVEEDGRAERREIVPFDQGAEVDP